MESIILYPQLNTYLSVFPAPEYRPGEALLAGGRGRNSFTTVMHFDLEKLPREGGITQATLKLFWHPRLAARPEEGELQLYRLLAPFPSRPFPFVRPVRETEPAAVFHLRPWPVSWIMVDVTELVSNWHKGAVNHGILVDLPSTGRRPALAAFCGTLHPHCRFWPQLIIVFLPRPFVSRVEKNIPVFASRPAFSLARDVSGFELATFVVVNAGFAPVQAALQLSPDGRSFVDQPPVHQVAPGDSIVLVPRYFLRFARVKLQVLPGGSGRADVWFQGRSS